MYNEVLDTRSKALDERGLGFSLLASTSTTNVADTSSGTCERMEYARHVFQGLDIQWGLQIDVVWLESTTAIINPITLPFMSHVADALRSVKGIWQFGRG